MVLHDIFQTSHWISSVFGVTVTNPAWSQSCGSQKLHVIICLCSVFAEQATIACLSHELLWPQGLLAGGSSRKSWGTNSSALDSVPSEDSFLAKRQQLLPLLTALRPLCHELFLSLHHEVSRGATAVVGQGGYTKLRWVTWALPAALATQKEMCKSVVAVWAASSGN